MFLYSILFSFQIVSFLIPDQAEATISPSAVLSSNFTVNSNATANVPSSTILVSMTTEVASIIVTHASTSVTHASTVMSVSSSSVTTPTSPPPSEGAQEAVVLTVADMTTVEFENKKGNFTSAVKKAVESYCLVPTRKCTNETSRKRRATTAEQVYIASGYPKQSSFAPSDLLVAVFVSTGGNKFLSKNILLNVIQDYQENLSSALGGKKITGVGRLHYEVITFSPTEAPASSGKTQLMYVFFGAFFGAVVILAVCICVTCWVGCKSEKENDVRPLTTSNLELVDK
ncbi:hypothetical protein OS493_019739 [Desmophyllum pertusum]|uniref:Uncharacterized protein n=1 Tax=Desmophyllum pertusum TaxID=174260 RepID=A0A9W9YZL3_9CNID|nr:hypothetical protein OS493_019739 [Desmophyllum pertusum]